jgi:K+-sensing histidine kinase KdpD
MYSISDQHIEEIVNSLSDTDVIESEINNNNSMINCPSLIAGMSHEMRTHMNAIVAFSYLMKGNGCNEDERTEYSDHIITSCEQLLLLFDNFLDSAIIDTCNSKADLKRCKLDNIIDDLLSEFRIIMRKSEHHNLELILENEYSNSAEVYIDINRVNRVIRNLFLNALENTSTGYIKIGYYFRDNKVTFYILDSGQGYFKCKEFLQAQNLNDYLTRQNDTYSTVSLILARKLVNIMDGTMWIESNGLTGCGLFFSVPVKFIENSGNVVTNYLNSKIAI